MPESLPVSCMTSSLTLDAIAAREEDAVVVDYILRASSSGGELGSGDYKYGFEDLCPVCGDKVSGYHYGLLTCESCKGFFKRTVQNKKVYSCVDNRSCHIDKSQRKRCPYCRFQKCLNVGMKLEAVRTDRMRGGRNKFGPMYKRDRALKQQAIRQQHHMMANCQMRLANGMEMFPNHTSGAELPDIKPDPAFLMSVANSLGYGMNTVSGGVNLNNLSQQAHSHPSATNSPPGSNIPSPTASEASPHDLRLHSSSSNLPHSPQNASSHQGTLPYSNNNGNYYNTPPASVSAISSPTHNMYQPFYNAAHSSNMPLLPQLIVDLKASAMDEREMKSKLLSFVNTEFGHEDFNSSSDYHSKLLRMLCRLSDQLLFLMVEWARTSVFFRELKVEDQMKLLQNCWSEILLLDLAQRLLKHAWGGELILGNGYKLSLDSLDELGLTDMKERILDIARKMKELKIDEHEYTCLKFLILLNPDVAEIDCQEFVEGCQEKVQAVLMEYCITFYPSVKDKFSQVLLRLPDIKLASMCGEEFLYNKHLSGELPDQTLLMEMLHSKKK
nr:putative steroidogenic factor 1 [Mya arenaria]